MSYEDRKAQADAFIEKIDRDLVKHAFCNCRICWYVNPNKLTKHCEDCILLREGIIEPIPKPNINQFLSGVDETEKEKEKKEQEKRELIIEKNMRIGELLSKCSDMLTAATYLANQKIVENEFVQCQNIALEDKCNRFGRPSKLSSRTFLYIVCFSRMNLSLNNTSVVVLVILAGNLVYLLEMWYL